MKITANQYAKTLFEITADKTKQEIDAVVANFLKVLIKNRKIKLATKIIEKFSEIFNKENGIVEAEVTTKSDMGQATSDKIKKFIKEKYKTEKVEINNVIDEKIQGGIIIRVGDEVMDASISNQLKNLKIQLAK
jgi:F-type H+-transporting ATPase subunit delta